MSPWNSKKPLTMQTNQHQSPISATNYSIGYVAGTCKRLQIAAAAKFEHNSRISQKITKFGGAIMVNGLKRSLPFLRCFGAKISNLKVICQNGVANPGDKYIWTDTFNNILLNFKGPDFFQSKPFENVATLRNR